MNKAFELILKRLEEKLRKSEKRYYRYLDDSNLSCMFDRSDIEEKRVDTIKEMLEIVQEVAEEYNVTHGDRIRSMSDEELAEFIEQVSTDSMDTISFGTKNYEEIWEHKESVLEFLKSKAE